MILKKIILKKLGEQILKWLVKKYNLDNIKEYVEEDNELDIKVRSLYKSNTRYGRTIEELEKDNAISKSKISKLEKKWLTLKKK